MVIPPKIIHPHECPGMWLSGKGPGMIKFWEQGPVPVQFLCLMNSLGVFPVFCLKARMNVLCVVKPQLSAIPLSVIDMLMPDSISCWA